MTTEFEDWKTFDYDVATIQLWVFKKSTASIKFRAWHVRTDEAVEKLFRDAIKSEVSRVTETVSYTHLSENNESSCLIHDLAESEGLIALLQAVDLPEAENTDAKLDQLKGAVGYLVKFQGVDKTIYAVRKTGPTWKPKTRSSLINTVFKNGELSAVQNETFSFDSFFDFYCIEETILISSKKKYESTVSDKKAYKKNFDDLTVDKSFISAFKDIAPLKKYVGQNSIHLRRMTVIQQKALYSKPDFTSNLKKVSDLRGWELKFDTDGKIDVCDKTARVVMQVLLDHRLLSEVTETTYDVPDAEVV